MARQRIRLTESQLHSIIRKCVNEAVNELDWKTYACVDRCLRKYLMEDVNNNTILYRCYDTDIISSKWIWLSSDFGDTQYGKNMAEFSVPLERFNIADSRTVIEYIKKYDIKNWDDAMYDEFIEPAMGFFDWEAYKNGDITDEDAYNQIPLIAWTEVMEHPSYFTFANKLKNDGYDGYCFTYIGDGYSTYYAFFNAKEILPYRTK